MDDGMFDGCCGFVAVEAVVAFEAFENSGNRDESG
jgi:hypothetical protein